MAKEYYALNKILHGQGPDDELVFMPGDRVTGLSKEAMVALWEAGSLEERDPDARPKDDRDDKIKELEAELERLKAEQMAAATAAVVVPSEGPAAELEQLVSVEDAGDAALAQAEGNGSGEPA